MHYILGIKFGNKLLYLTSTNLEDTSNWITDAKKFDKEEIISTFGEDLFVNSKKEISKYENLRVFDTDLLQKEIEKETQLRSKIKKYR